MFVVEKLGEDVWVAVAWEEGGEIFRMVGKREDVDEMSCVVRNEAEFATKEEAEEALKEMEV